MERPAAAGEGGEEEAEGEEEGRPADIDPRDLKEETHGKERCNVRMGWGGGERKLTRLGRLRL